MRVIGDFLSGAITPFRAVALIAKTPRLFLWCLLPFSISVLVYFLLWGNVLAPLRDSIEIAFQGWIAGLLGHNQYSTLGSAATWVVGVAVSLLFFVTMLFSFAWVSNLAALPVNDFVAQATERALVPSLQRPSGGTGLRHELHLIWIDATKSFLSLAGFLICLSVGWIPIVNFAAVVIAWIFLAYQFVSYPHTRRGIGAREGLIEMLKYFPLSVGFGATIAIGFSIPIISVFVPPVAVVGGTILFSKMRRAPE
jgi:uncharacterized protein involved in cysteine biosynthesis